MTIETYREFLTDEDLSYIEQKIAQPAWSCNHKSNDNPNSSVFWQMSGLDLDEFFSVYLLNKIKQVTKNNFTIERIYFNGHNACSQGYPHTDSDKENGRTFLIYCNRVWDLAFGGSTSFIIDNEVKSFFPYPKSAVYFQSNYTHLANPISKDFKGVRITLAFKLNKI
jgi:hypothetical protein